MKKNIYLLMLLLPLMGNLSVKAMDDDNKENNVKYCLAQLYNNRSAQEIGYYFLDMKLTENEVKGKIKKFTSSATRFFTTTKDSNTAAGFNGYVFRSDNSADGVFVKEALCDKSVVFTEKQLKDYLIKLFSEQTNKGGSSHNDGIHKNNEYINKLKESKEEAIIIFKKNGKVITQTIEQYVPEINNKTGGGNGNTSKKKNQIKTKEEEDADQQNDNNEPKAKVNNNSTVGGDDNKKTFLTTRNAAYAVIGLALVAGVYKIFTSPKPPKSKKKGA